jgi:crotonobetaine/carnitine-CoA ligase
MMSGGCFIIADRFSPRRFWTELADTRATITTFLGLMPPLLLAQPPAPDEKRHCCRVGIAAGLPRKTREDFESRFGILMLDGWGMTELARNIGNYREPRDLSTSAMGRPRDGMDVRVVDEAGNDVLQGETGELIMRARGADPRDGFSDGYLKDPEATAFVWRGGWFHTGDSVRQGPDGMLYFVDRKKNIIRRSGENIAAGEIEQALASHPAVALCAVLAVPDAMRQEEVLACVVPRSDATAGAALAESIVEHALARLAYYKAPGWVRFVAELPTTGSQKVQKFRLFADGDDPLAGAIDLRARKQRRV